MKRLSALNLCLLAGLILFGFAAPAPAAWNLVWSDEFDGPNLDATKWAPDIGTGCPNLCGWGNNELQYYRAENISFSGGNLVLTAEDESFGGAQYTSGKITTRDRFSVRYGRIEMRAQLPKGGGMWPAFWMMPQDDVYGGWAASGEIDIMESSNQMDYIAGTIHFGGSWPNHVNTGGSYAPGGADFSQGFHIYAVEWEPNEIRWYVDDVLYSVKTNVQWYSDGAPGNSQAPFDQDFYIILNTAVGGNYTGCTSPACITASFPQDFLVDYVRVYEEAVGQQSPYNEAFVFPTRIQAEDYDQGGSGVAYQDEESLNLGGAYRTAEGVDIEVCTDTGGGFNVGWVRPSEWVEYTVDVPWAGDYIFEARVSSGASGGLFRLEFDGIDKTGALTVSPTGGWQNWDTITFSATLDAGTQVMRFNPLAGEFNVNWFEVVLVPTAIPPHVVTPLGLESYPNPFNPRTTIRFELDAPSSVDLVIYDAQGRRVRTLVSGESLAPGQHARAWDGRDAAGRVASGGVYFGRLDTGDQTATVRMVLLK